LELRLVAPDLEVEQPIQRRTWRGRETAIVFVARFKSETSATETLARVLVYYEGVPVGYVVFHIARRETEIPAGTVPPPAAARLRRFTSAFISYSSADRLHVLRHHQLLALVGIKVFQDVLSLDPGQRWASRLYESIKDCDLVLVYWSAAAAASQWVRNEVEYALSVQQTRPDLSPTIVPVLLEGPPPPRPPDSLAALHFDDPLRYIIYAHEQLEAGH